jgi:BCD family chlorophyll transporter-like MFS transporter
MYRGTMVQFCGLAIMPFALLVLARQGEAEHAPVWLGLFGAAAAFLLVGAGLHTIQTIGLALATDRASVESQPKVVGLMYITMLVGMMVSALGFGWFLADFTPGRLVQVIQAAAVATIALNVVALWKQEPRGRSNQHVRARDPSFAEAWSQFAAGGNAVRRLIAIGMGTMAFSMEDVLLEPYGGQVLGLAVGDTTKLTATFAVGGLMGFALASVVLSRGFDPFRMAALGALGGVASFATVIAAGPTGSTLLFAAGTAGIGFSAGLFGHGTLTATMHDAPKGQTGLALGAWGAVQASAAGLAIALGGVLRDVVALWIPGDLYRGAVPYDCVYTLEIAFLLATLALMAPLVRRVAALA